MKMFFSKINPSLEMELKWEMDPGQFGLGQYDSKCFSLNIKYGILIS